MSAPGAHILAGLATIYDELGVGAPVARLLKDAWGEKSYRGKEFYDKLKKLRGKAEEHDAPPKGWIAADDAEAMWGMNLRGVMLSWLHNPSRMKFAYIRGCLTPILSAKELWLLLKKPLWTSCSLIAREEGMPYMAIYHRLRPTTLKRKMIQGWRGDKKVVYLREAVDWERKGWRSCGHTSAAMSYCGRPLKNVRGESVFDEARGYEVAADAVLSITQMRNRAIRREQQEIRAEEMRRKAKRKRGRNRRIEKQ